MSIEVPRTDVNSSKPQDGDRAALEEVDRAVQGIGLKSAFQPIVALPDGAVVGFEALARWPRLRG